MQRVINIGFLRLPHPKQLGLCCGMTSWLDAAKGAFRYISLLFRALLSSHKKAIRLAYYRYPGDRDPLLSGRCLLLRSCEESQADWNSY